MPNKKIDMDEVVVTRHRNRTRKVKMQEQAVKEVKEKFLPEQGDIPLPCKGMEFFPRGRNQRALKNMLDEAKQAVFAIGPAGTGKSIVAVNKAASLLRSKSIEQIYLVRPAVSVGKSVGLLPGELKDKLAPYFAQTITHFEKFLGKGFTKYCLDKSIIDMCAVEYLRGTSFENCFVLVEECQNFTEEEFEMMLTRIGENCIMVFTGDQKQTDLKGNNGLVRTLNFLRNAKSKNYDKLDTDDINELTRNIGVVEFTFDDVQRSGIVKALTKLYFYKEA